MRKEDYLYYNDAWVIENTSEFEKALINEDRELLLKILNDIEAEISRREDMRLNDEYNPDAINDLKKEVEDALSNL